MTSLDGHLRSGLGADQLPAPGLQPAGGPDRDRGAAGACPELHPPDPCRSPWPLQLLALSLATLAVKGVLLPWLLRRAMREADVQREIEPFVGFNASVLVGIALLGLCFLISSRCRRRPRRGPACCCPARCSPS